MAVAYTLTTGGNGSIGNMRVVTGTFTSAAGDGNGETLAYATHGLNFLAWGDVTLDTGGLMAARPKVSISSGTLTWTVDDTLGYNGRFIVIGR